MTQAEIVALGNYSEALMQGDQFNTLCETFRQNAFNTFMATTPEDVKKREAIYGDVWGLQQFLGHTRSFVDARDNINTREQVEAEFISPLD